MQRAWARSKRWVGARSAAPERAAPHTDDRVARLEHLLGEMKDRLQYQLQTAQQRQRYAPIRELALRSGWDPRDLSGFESSVFSQNGEDGVLQEILRRIGIGERYFVEIGAHAAEANCLVFADILGWRGCFVEADHERLIHLQRKYAGVDTVTVIETRVAADTIDVTLETRDIPADFDVLSIDVDGNDYWLWRGLQRHRPRVVVIEFNASLPADSRLVQPYDGESQWDGTAFFGASRGALLDLAHAKGYRLVHCDIAGVNLFFVREDLAEHGFLPERDVVSRPVNYALSAALHPEPAAGRAYVDAPDTV